jgi:hypothetical protein
MHRIFKRIHRIAHFAIFDQRCPELAISLRVPRIQANRFQVFLASFCPPHSPAVGIT